MDAVTYPNEQVADYISKHFVPLQLNVVDDPGAMDQFHAVWTPTIILRDDGGHEFRRSEGYLDPKTMIAELALARLQSALHQKRYDEAEPLAEEAVLSAAGDEERLAEARYWAGVAAYKSSDDARKLLGHWKPLLDEMPNTIWARKAGFIKDS